MEKLTKFIVDRLIIALEIVLDEAGRCQSDEIMSHLLWGTLLNYYNDLASGVTPPHKLECVTPDQQVIIDIAGKDIHCVCVIEQAVAITCLVLDQLNIESIIDEKNKTLGVTIEKYTATLLTKNVPRYVAYGTHDWFTKIVSQHVNCIVFTCDQHDIAKTQPADSQIFQLKPSEQVSAGEAQLKPSEQVSAGEISDM